MGAPGLSEYSRLCKVKIFMLVCVFILLTNYLVFLHFHKVAPRSLHLDKRATTPILFTPTIPAPRLRPSHRPISPKVKDVAGKGHSGTLVTTTEAKISKTTLPLVAGNASKPTEEVKDKNGNRSSTVPVGMNLSDLQKGPALNASNVTAPEVNCVAMPAQSVTARDKQPVCPEKPPELVGRFPTILTPVQLSWVEQKYPCVNKGGHYRPPDCKAREKLAIIIPCRQREEHLYILLNNLLAMLIRQRLDFSIFVIDQELPTNFNRGMLFNVGYLEALKRDNYDCFILHDVDMIPTNDNCFYRCTHNPRHFLGGLSKWEYELPYHQYYGGVVSFSKWQYQNINGGSNLYFGWGGEDDDLLNRVLSKGYSIVRYPKLIGRYDSPSHKRDKGNGDNPLRFKLMNDSIARQDVEGLSTTDYEVTEVVETQLFTKIKVLINMTQLFDTYNRAPRTSAKTKA